MVHGPPARRKSQSQQANNGSANCEMEMDPLPTPPDGGWGWVVVFGSFMIHIVSKYISVRSCTVGQLGFRMRYRIQIERNHAVIDISNRPQQAIYI